MISSAPMAPTFPMRALIIYIGFLHCRASRLPTGCHASSSISSTSGLPCWLGAAGMFLHATASKEAADARILLSSFPAGFVLEVVIGFTHKADTGTTKILSAGRFPSCKGRWHRNLSLAQHRRRCALQTQMPSVSHAEPHSCSCSASCKSRLSSSCQCLMLCSQ